MNLRKLLRSEEGSVLVDSMVGVIVTAIVVGSVASLTVNINMSLQSTNADAIRSRAVQSLVNDVAIQPGAVPAEPVTTVRNVGGAEVPVTVWKSTPTVGSEAVSASISRYNGGVVADCSAPATIDLDNCILSSVTVNRLDALAPVALDVPTTWSNPAVAGGTPTAAAGAIGSFDATGRNQVRYVAKLSDATGPGTLTFSSGSTILATIPYDTVSAAAPAYVYGAVTVTGSGPVDIRVSGAPVSLSRFYIYEVPR